MLTKMFNKVCYSEKGASLVEYSLLILLIAMAAFIAVQVFGGVLSNTYDDIGTDLYNANNPS